MDPVVYSRPPVVYFCFLLSNGASLSRDKALYLICNTNYP